MTITERIERRLVDDGECRVWTGSRNQKQYGFIKLAGERSPRLVHRVVWALAHGPIPDGMLVCHHCDNPPCARLAHLFLGTHGDNRRDSARKGRHQGQGRTHCPHGHEYTEDNTYRSKEGWRSCHACRLIRGRIQRPPVSGA